MFHCFARDLFTHFPLLMDIGLLPVFLCIITNSASQFIPVYISSYSMCQSFSMSLLSNLVTATLVRPEHRKWSWSTLRWVSVKKSTGL